MKLVLILIISISSLSISKTYNFCSTCNLNNFNTAFSLLQPGDTLLIEDDTYNGGTYHENLKGNPNNYIFIIGNGNVIINGGYSAFQIRDWEYIRFENITFQNQTSNGFNVDDGGSVDSPTQYIQFHNCTFKDMQSTGNNDLLKLSGLDNFLISNCKFENGSPGGSGIDMVGCHSGTITQNSFTNMGSEAIQGKGGTSELYIERNYFNNAGARGINLGGSTGLEYFRPIDAKYEAKNLWVYSNIFIGSTAPLAFVNSVNVEITNNTFINPEKWIFRILQESVGERFIECGDNSIINNLFYVNEKINFTPVNIGPNTRPESFEISDNFFYNVSNSNWSPNLINPTKNYINIDPIIKSNYTDLDSTSNLVGKGKKVTLPKYDFNGKEFLNQRSIGAIEGGIEENTTNVNMNDEISFKIYNNLVELKSEDFIKSILIFDFNGKKINEFNIFNKNYKLELINKFNVIIIETEKYKYLKIIII